MDKIDMIFTVIFVVGTGITLILIYYYNKRHTYEPEDEIDEYEVDVQSGKKELYSSSDTFSWNLYESDLKYDYDKFIGYDEWSTKESAEERIEILKSKYKNSKSSIDINMIESMMLVEKHGDEIILDSKGVYRIKEINLDNFIETLEYGIETIRLIASIRDELQFSIENYEIDAKKIFYIMKNAKSLGFSNIQNNSQIFLFARKYNNKTFDAELLTDENESVNNITIETIGFNDESFSYSKEKNEEDKKNIFEEFHNLTRNQVSYTDNDGNKIIEYPNGEKIIKKSLWEVQEIIEESKFDDTKKFENIIKPDSAENIMNENNNIDSVNSLNDSKNNNINSNNMGDKKTEDEYSFKTKNNYINNTMMFDEENEKISLLGYFGNVNTLEDFVQKLNELSQQNIKVLIILIFRIESAFIEIDDNKIFLHFIDADNRYYVSYEHISIVLLSLIKNPKEFLAINLFSSASGSLQYPFKLIDEFLLFLKDKEMDFFNTERSSLFVLNDNKIYISAITLEVKVQGRELIELYNTEENMNQVRTHFIERDEFKKQKENKFSINFKYFI